MRLLIDCLKFPEPNLAHVLLGFNTKDFSKSDLQKNPYHPLQIILKSLQKPEFAKENPELTVQYYEYVHMHAL